MLYSVCLIGEYGLAPGLCLLRPHTVLVPRELGSLSTGE